MIALAIVWIAGPMCGLVFFFSFLGHGFLYAFSHTVLLFVVISAGILSSAGALMSWRAARKEMRGRSAHRRMLRERRRIATRSEVAGAIELTTPSTGGELDLVSRSGPGDIEEIS